MDWKATGLRTVWHTTREFDEHIKAIRAMFDDDLFRCVGEKCPKFVWEIKQWRIDERTGKQLDEHNHAMSNFRYAVANIKKIRRKALRYRRRSRWCSEDPTTDSADSATWR